MKKNTSAILLVAGLLIVFIGLNFLFIVDTPGVEENEQTGKRSSYLSTPFGTLAFYTLLEESGYRVTRLNRPFTELASHDEIGTLVIIGLPAANNPSQDEFKSLIEWVESGGLLVIIDRDIRASFGEANVTTAPADFKTIARPLQPTLYTRGVSSVALSKFATRVSVDGGAATYHIGADQSAALADAQVGAGRILLLTDPYIVANNGILQDKADNATLALNLFVDRPDGVIAFDEYHHVSARSADGGLMSYVRGTPVPWMMGQSALLALLVVYTYGRRFGRPLPLKRERRTTNLEFVSSMANITRLARASDLAVQNIYSEFRKRLCRYSGLPAKTETATLAVAAARRAGIDESEMKQLLARCEEVSRGEPVTDSQLLDMISRIREIESSLRL